MLTLAAGAPSSVFAGGSWGLSFFRLVSSPLYSEENGNESTGHPSNRWQQNGAVSFSATFTSNGNGANNNRMDGYSYDTPGNLISDKVHTYSYDAENRLISITGGTVNSTYVYDADGRRVVKTGNNNECQGYAGDGVYYLYDLEGHEEVMSPNGLNDCRDEIYADGRHLATYNEGDTFFVHTDWLGTERVRHPYYNTYTTTCTSLPFGDNLVCANPSTLDTPTPMHFTGKEHDSESGLDNFGARYNSSSMGRFMSPDPSNQGIDFYFPQSWNHYAYVLNNPLRMVDPNGLWPTWVHKDIIDRSFPGMSKEQRQILKDASAKVDSDQSTEGAYKHGMANGNDASGSVNAMQDSADFIKQNEHDAEDLQQQWIDSGHTGLSPAALQAFGNALHTITDETSPSHEGFQPWYGAKDPLEWPGDAWHFLREACPGSVCQGNRRRQQEAVDRARRAFSLVFWYTQQSQPTATVTVTTCMTGPDGKTTCTTYH